MDKKFQALSPSQQTTEVEQAERGKVRRRMRSRVEKLDGVFVCAGRGEEERERDPGRS